LRACAANSIARFNFSPFKRMSHLIAGARSRARLLGAFTILAMAALAVSSRASAQVFHPGDLVVSAYGNTSATMADGQPTAISLIDFSPTGGAAVSTLVLPTADGVGGSQNLGIVAEYGSSSEGNIQPSGNGLYLTIGAYSAAAAAKGIQPATNSANKTKFATGTPYSTSTVALGQSADTDVPRIALTIDAYGNVNSSSVFNDLYNTNNPRSVYSVDGISYLYFSGQGDKSTADQGIFYAPVGLNTTQSSTTPTGIYTAKDTRFVTAYNGNLYYSLDKSGAPTGIFEFTGLPTSAANATQITAASGVSGSVAVNFSPEGFFFANATTLYVADTGVPKVGGTGDGGIQKWVYNGSSWNLQYTFANPSYFVSPTTASSASSGETGFEAITGKVSGNSVQLFAVSYTAGDDNPNGLFAITDPLNATSTSGQNFTEIETASGNGSIVFKGVTLALNTATPTDTPTMPQWALIILAALLLALAATRLPKFGAGAARP
jgi:hypothetical protein